MNTEARDSQSLPADTTGVIQRMSFNLGKTETLSQQNAQAILELQRETSVLASRIALTESKADEALEMMKDLHDTFLIEKEAISHIQEAIETTSLSVKEMSSMLHYHIHEEADQYAKQSERMTKLNFEQSTAISELSHKLIKVFIIVSTLVVLISTFLRDEAFIELAVKLLGG